jgi:predicted Zn finger-like uncharacterized protein
MTMVITCESCLARFRLDKGLLKGSKAVRVRCRKCGGPIVVMNPDVPEILPMVWEAPKGSGVPAEAPPKETPSAAREREESSAPAPDRHAPGETPARENPFADGESFSTILDNLLASLPGEPPVSPDGTEPSPGTEESGVPEPAEPAVAAVAQEPAAETPADAVAPGPPAETPAEAVAQERAADAPADAVAPEPVAESLTDAVPPEPAAETPAEAVAPEEAPPDAPGRVDLTGEAPAFAALFEDLAPKLVDETPPDAVPPAEAAPGETAAFTEEREEATAPEAPPVFPAEDASSRFDPLDEDWPAPERPASTETVFPADAPAGGVSFSAILDDLLSSPTAGPSVPSTGEEHYPWLEEEDVPESAEPASSSVPREPAVETPPDAVPPAEAPTGETRDFAEASEEAPAPEAPPTFPDEEASSRFDPLDADGPAPARPASSDTGFTADAPAEGMSFSAILDDLLSSPPGDPPVPPAGADRTPWQEEADVPEHAEPAASAPPPEPGEPPATVVASALDALMEPQVPDAPVPPRETPSVPFPFEPDPVRSNAVQPAGSGTLSSALDELFVSAPAAGTVHRPAPEKADRPERVAPPPPPRRPNGRPPYTRPLFLVGVGLWLVLLTGGALLFGTGGAGGKIGGSLLPSTGAAPAAVPAGRSHYAVRDVAWNFFRKTDAGDLLVLKGTVVNAGLGTSAGIRIQATLLGKDNVVVGERDVFAGNVLDNTALRHASRPILTGLLNLRFGDGDRNRDIPPGGSLPFMVVFFDPPPNIDSIEVKGVDAP